MFAMSGASENGYPIIQRAMIVAMPARALSICHDAGPAREIGEAPHLIADRDFTNQGRIAIDDDSLPLGIG